MIITCPECETRYTVKAAAFKAPGRKVRCANCGNEWMQAPEEDAAKPAAPVAEEAAVPAVEEEIPAPPPAAPAAKDAADTTGAADSEDDAGVDDARAVVARAREAAAEREKAKKEKVSSPFVDEKASSGKTWGVSRSQIVGWVLLIGFVSALVGSLVAFRGDIVRFWPATTAIYEFFGLPVAVQGMGFRQISSEEFKENGLKVLAIRGQIVNSSDRVQAVPRVRVALRDKSGVELYHYFFAIPEGELAPGTQAEFVTRLSSPPAAADDVLLRFVEPGEFIEAAPSDVAPDTPEAEATPDHGDEEAGH